MWILFLIATRMLERLANILMIDQHQQGAEHRPEFHNFVGSQCCTYYSTITNYYSTVTSYSRCVSSYVFMFFVVVRILAFTFA